MTGLLKLLFPDFCTKGDLEASRKSLSGEISHIKQAVLGEQDYTDKNFHILASKIDQIEAQIQSLGAKNSQPKGILADFNLFARLSVQNYEDMKIERAKAAAFEETLSKISLQIEELTKELYSTKLNLTQLTQLNSVNSTKLNSTKLNWKRGMTAMTAPVESQDKSVIPGFIPEGESKLTQGHYSVLFVLYNLQADLGSRAVSVKTLVKEIYGEKSGHSKESFVSRIVRELDASGLVVKGPRGRTTRVYLSKSGVEFCKSHVLTRKEESQ